MSRESPKVGDSLNASSQAPGVRCQVMNTPQLRFIIYFCFADEPWAALMGINWKHYSALAIETKAGYAVLKRHLFVLLNK